MKKSIIIAILTVFTTVGFAQKQKLGHVNTQQIMQSLAVKDSIQMKFLQFQTMLQGELERLQNDLVAQEKELAAAQASKSLPEEIIQQRYAALLKDKQEFQEVTYPQMQQTLQNKMTELQIPLEAKITEAIEKVAKANGFTYVFQLEATLYAGGEDITKMVRKELGLSEEPEEDQMGMPGMQGMPMGR